MIYLLVFWTTFLDHRQASCRICNPPHLDDKKGFAILLAADCKSAGLKEVGAFLDDGLQIRRNEIPTDFESGRIPGGMFV